MLFKIVKKSISCPLPQRIVPFHNQIKRKRRQNGYLHVKKHNLTK